MSEQTETAPEDHEARMMLAMQRMAEGMDPIEFLSGWLKAFADSGVIELVSVRSRWIETATTTLAAFVMLVDYQDRLLTGDVLTPEEQEHYEGMRDHHRAINEQSAQIMGMTPGEFFKKRRENPEDSDRDTIKPYFNGLG